MVMMGFRCGFITRAAITKVMAIQYAGFFKQADGSINSRNRNAGINRRRTRVQRFNVGMVFRIGKNARDDAALLRDAKALFLAQGFNIDQAGQIIGFLGKDIPFIKARASKSIARPP
jgi:hypothetical protein